MKPIKHKTPGVEVAQTPSISSPQADTPGSKIRVRLKLSKKSWASIYAQRKAYHKKYYETHKDKINAYHKTYYKTYAKIYQRLRHHTDPKFALNERMRRLIRQSLHYNGGNKGGKSWKDWVGYTTEQLRDHLMRLFTEGMTWELFLQGEIHIDHIIPKNTFHYTSMSDPEFKKCWALSNLQPLWVEDHHKKHSKT